jgi:hypothetical protein
MDFISFLQSAKEVIFDSLAPASHPKGMQDSGTQALVRAHASPGFKAELPSVKSGAESGAEAYNIHDYLAEKEGTARAIVQRAFTPPGGWMVWLIGAGAVGTFLLIGSTWAAVKVAPIALPLLFPEAELLRRRHAKLRHDNELEENLRHPDPESTMEKVMAREAGRKKMFGLPA